MYELNVDDEYTIVNFTDVNNWAVWRNADINYYTCSHLPWQDLV